MRLIFDKEFKIVDLEPGSHTLTIPPYQHKDEGMIVVRYASGDKLGKKIISYDRISKKGLAVTKTVSIPFQEFEGAFTYLTSLPIQGETGDIGYLAASNLLGVHVRGSNGSGGIQYFVDNILGKRVKITTASGSTILDIASSQPIELNGLLYFSVSSEVATGATNGQVVTKLESQTIHPTTTVSVDSTIEEVSGGSAPDTTSPIITSATVEDANPDQLVVNIDEAVNISNVIGLSLNGDWS